MKYIVNCSFVLLLFNLSCKHQSNAKDTGALDKQKLPNIVIIYLDDLGYGDVGAYGTSRLNTPNIDMLAENGVRFTNGYASSATCTPSRYSLLTGTYPWRNADAQILPGSAPLIIDTAQITLPKMLKEKGFRTGIVGKWHLGLGNKEEYVDWNKKIGPGPNEVGFDYSYIMAATQDRVPTVYIKNGLVENLDPSDPIEISYAQNFKGQPTGKNNPELLKLKSHHSHNNSIVNGIGRIGYMKGGEKAKWIDEDMADQFLEKAQQFVSTHRKQPFFLYYALQQPHVPRTPHQRFMGRSGLGPRGDVIVEADWCVGELIKTLKDEKLLENTLIVLTSDNGPVLNDGYYDQAVEKLGDHNPFGPLRGGKYSLYEAGTRVPFIVYWKGEIKPSVSDALVSQVDILSSLAQLTKSEIRTNDSEDLWDVFNGNSKKGREELIIEATKRKAIRQGDWIMIPPHNGPLKNYNVNIELGNSSDYQLYKLSDDIQQKQNLAKQYPAKLQVMKEAFMEQVEPK